MNLDEAFARLILPTREGGYQDGSGDPGGETKYGISKRRYPNEDIKNLTKSRAKTLYLRDYWATANCESVHDAARFAYFEIAVLSGPARATMGLQAAVGATVDGEFGMKTLAAMHAMHPQVCLVRMVANYLTWLTTLKNWPAAGKSWARRMMLNILEGVPQ